MTGVEAVDPATVEFRDSRGAFRVPVERLVDAVTEFLELYAEPPLVPTDFRAVIGDGDGEARWVRVLEEAGCAEQPGSFFEAVLSRLGEANGSSRVDVVVGDLRLPYQLLLTILEVVIPGDDVLGVRSVRRLEKLTNSKVPPADRDALRKVLQLYPVRLSSHVIRQMRLSPDVAYQYLPVAEELNPDGLVHTWVGQFHRGVVEQMYRNRVIFVLNMSCPVYCRFCFRKHKECRDQRPPSQKHVDLGVGYIRSCPDIKEVVLTGGDPFMNRATLTRAIDGLAAVPHVETLRVATRSIAYHPALFTSRGRFWLDYLKRKQLELRQRGTHIEVATHFIHPDEVSVQSLNLITELVASGVPVYVQTPFLGGCNDTGETLASLFRQLRAAGAEIHYVFLPCSPIQGNARYRSPISRALETARFLRANLSDRAMPHFCTATAIGKVDWGTSGWAVEADPDDDRFLWIRTPYTTEYFESFAPILDLSRVARPNPGGTLDARFMADIGDARLLRGPEALVEDGAPAGDAAPRPDAVDSAALAHLQQLAADDRGPGWTVVPADRATLTRVAPGRVELDCDAGEAAVDEALQVIADDMSISDAVLFCRRDIVRSLHRITALVARLQQVAHITAVRLRSPSLSQRPDVFSDGVVNRLAALNQLTVTRPTRLEVETRFLHSSELTSEHGRVVGSLRQRGVAVYCNIPLLRLVNHPGDEVATITDRCRRIGIEVHNLYLAGLPIQADWSREHPFHVSEIVDLGTRLRRACSGRQLPHLVIRTAFGEVDFGLSAEVVGADERGWARLKLLPFTVDPESWAAASGASPVDAVDVGSDGHPVVSVPGLVA